MPEKEEGISQPEIFGANAEDQWRLVEPSVWRLEAEARSDGMGRMVLRTLFDQPRWIQPRFLYDKRGSILFEKICTLPEYYLTRTEDAILAREAANIIRMAPVQCIVELGAGFSRKTLHLLREQARQRERGVFAPIDVSLTALTVSRQLVERDFPHLEFQGLWGPYEEGISSISGEIPTLFAFLGSTIGNLDPVSFDRFFRHLGSCMGPRDFLLLGVDRPKDPLILEKAYNDSQGITAEFILNVFEHINRITGSNFRRDKIGYLSFYDSQMQQIEMYGVSRCHQQIRFTTTDASFVWREGERILVEISRKFDPERLEEQLRFFDLEAVAHFADPEKWFSVMLFKKV